MIILFGLAGSGKGTQGKALSEIFGWKWLSVGQVIRNTGVYDKITNSGKLVPDEEVIKLMDKQIEKAEDEGFDVILDGYPRSETQAKYLVETKENDLDGAIILEVPKEELYKRLELRGREDDQEKSSIDRRFEIFEQNISSILPLFEAHNIPIERVNGLGPIHEVTGRLINVVKQFRPDATEQLSDVNGGEIEKSYGE
ncbi:nucleoside monophosphate kinase [Candidatus Saccharibacteria bacterium]|nr:nucleoside monophosphate kinase [Candidatus Saccharibacteria bacterium]